MLQSQMFDFRRRWVPIGGCEIECCLCDLAIVVFVCNIVMPLKFASSKVCLTQK